ncbi:glutamate synthase [Nitzschia inconspicua]|uniref:Glutamate synthase n=1 Tax=Nitzschia inconspicua TaxID=303405 RepID=A0A9K3LMA6_9STRA|nr:glutamate synthase [Nitzschia inconspicua]
MLPSIVSVGGVPLALRRATMLCCRLPHADPLVLRRSAIRSIGGGNSTHKSSTTSGKSVEEGVNIKHVSAGLPDFIEHWDRPTFRNVGFGMTAVTLATIPLFQETVLTVGMGTVTAVYWAIGLNDIRQRAQTIRRNFPVLGNLRYLFEMIRPEIRQYFVEGDDEAVPFSRNHRAIAYQRSKGIGSSMPFGTRRNVEAVGYEWVLHSTLSPTQLDASQQRVMIGGNNREDQGTTQPYDSSLLNISAMSYGALSDRAILALSSGAKLGNFSHNTGEGGMSDFHKEGGAALVWNIGTAYFGCGKFSDEIIHGTRQRVFDPDLFVQNATLPNCRMIEIKLSQGAKPAHGGMLPKEKISESIAKARNLDFPVQEDCLSPARHSAFSTPTELCEFIQLLRTLSGGKPVGMKLCMGSPYEFCRIVQAFLETGIHPDFITIDGGEGGTGAAPPEFSNSVGTPLAEGLSFAHALLVGVGLRDPVDKSKSKVTLIASGKVLTGFSMYKNFAIGADVCNAARSFLFSLGCIQALKCNTNTCPTGITTQDPELSWGLDPLYKQVRVANFHRATVQACVELMEATGVESWATIHPKQVIRRVGLGNYKSYDQVWEHLQVGKGELLSNSQSTPQFLQTVWNECNR